MPRRWAYPGIHTELDAGKSLVPHHDPGMDLRDWLAGQALAGLGAGVNIQNYDAAEVAEAAVALAEHTLEKLDL